MTDESSSGYSPSGGWNLHAVYHAAEQACPQAPWLANFGTPEAPIPTPLMAAHVALQQRLQLTWLLLGTFVGFFIFTTILSFAEPVPGMSALELLGANEPRRVSSGETFRLLMAVFLHRDFWHLLMNTFGLFFIAKYAEPLFGKSRFLLIFVWGGLAGNVVSYLFRDSGLSVGASGAILAELSALTLFPLRSGRILPETARKRLFWTCFPWLLMNLWYTWSTPQVDVGGHVGGLLAGAIAGLTMHSAVIDPWSAKRWPVRLWTLATAALCGWLISRFVLFYLQA